MNLDQLFFVSLTYTQVCCDDKWGEKYQFTYPELLEGRMGYKHNFSLLNLEVGQGREELVSRCFTRLETEIIKSVLCIGHKSHDIVSK